MYTQISKPEAMQAYFDGTVVYLTHTTAISAEKLEENMTAISINNANEYFDSRYNTPCYFWLRTPTLTFTTERPVSIKAIDNNVCLEYPDARTASKLASYLKSQL